MVSLLSRWLTTSSKNQEVLLCRVNHMVVVGTFMTTGIHIVGNRTMPGHVMGITTVSRPIHNDLFFHSK